VSNIVPFDQQLQLAEAFCKSGLFGVRTKEQAIALMAICEAEGLHPAKAVQEYHIIQGRPALKADAMLARFQSAGGKVAWSSMTDTRVAGVFSHAQGGSIEIEWTIDMAKRAGLTKNPTWNQYPRAMLRARCISEGIRSVFPGVVVGTYTPEEVADMEPAPRPVRDMGDADVVEPPPPPPPPPPAVDVEALIEQIQLASTLEFLETLRPQMRRVPKGADRDRVVLAVQRRAEEIRAESVPADPAITQAEEGAL
jgi:hypothetical protein